MFNKPFKLEVTATSPYGYKEDGAGNLVGITLSGKIETKDETFLNDLVLGGSGKDQIPVILSGKLPIDKDVSLVFTKRNDLLLNFPNCPKLSAEITEVSVFPGLVNGRISAGLKLKVDNVTSIVAGEIVSRLKSTVQVELASVQKDLFEEQGAGGKRKGNKPDLTLPSSN
jgi:hypothetical protein